MSGLEKKDWAQWTAKMEADANRKTHVLSTKSKSGEAQVRDKGEKETELKSERGGRNRRREKKHKATARFLHMLFCDLLKFIILSPLSHTQDPFSQHP